LHTQAYNTGYTKTVETNEYLFLQDGYRPAFKCVYMYTHALRPIRGLMHEFNSSTVKLFLIRNATYV